MYKFRNYYFLGIGGIGMSALARYFLQLGYSVFGYDRNITNLTNQLIKEGIIISFSDDILLPNCINSKDTLVIYSSAIPDNLILKKFFIQNNFIVYKRAEVLGFITKYTECLAISGTHGKTTVSTLLSHIFFSSNKNFFSLLGGISENYNSNFIYQGNYFSIVEADEFDYAFLYLSPDYSIVTSIDVDHLDIYQDYQSIQKSFQNFVNLVPKNKKIFVHHNVLISGSNVYKYSIDQVSDYYASKIIKSNNKIIFDFNFPGGKYSNIEYYLPGDYNLENVVAALALAMEFNFSKNELIYALKSFKGIKRRFSIYKLTNSRKYIDDYAHHPTEIKVVLQAIHELFGKKKILVVFQPHLFSRTQELMDDFAQSLENVSELILLDIYPARELPIPGVTSKVLFDKINLKYKTLTTLDKVVNIIKSKNFDIVVTLGAGNIDTIVDKIQLI